jgi:hypothetical protein
VGISLQGYHRANVDFSLTLEDSLSCTDFPTGPAGPIMRGVHWIRNVVHCLHTLLSQEDLGRARLEHPGLTADVCIGHDLWMRIAMPGGDLLIAASPASGDEEVVVRGTLLSKALDMAAGNRVGVQEKDSVELLDKGPRS